MFVSGALRRGVGRIPGIRTAYFAFRSAQRREALLDAVRQERLVDAWGLRTDRTRNPLTAHPRRYWSQSDEDGILEKILRRTGPRDSGTFIEYGVGNGSECNALMLLAQGWKGAWISGQDLMFTPRPDGRLSFQHTWVTRANVLELTRKARSDLGHSTVDVVSCDLDGNDFHLTETLLDSGLRPKVWIAEYNARFPVGVVWAIEYSDTHTWSGDDYFGASISAFAELFENRGYFPAACSATGANVFFVSNEFRDRFQDIPQDLEAIYQPPLYNLAPKWGHTPSARTLSSLKRPRFDAASL